MEPNQISLSAQNRELNTFKTRWERSIFITDIKVDGNSNTVSEGCYERTMGGYLGSFFTKSFSDTTPVEQQVSTLITRHKTIYVNHLENLSQFNDDDVANALQNQILINQIIEIGGPKFVKTTIPPALDDLIAQKLLALVNSRVEKVSLRDIESSLKKGFDPQTPDDQAILALFPLIDSFHRHRPALFQHVSPLRQLKRLSDLRNSNQRADQGLRTLQTLLPSEIEIVKLNLKNERLLKYLLDAEYGNNFDASLLSHHWGYLSEQADLLVERLPVKILSQMIRTGHFKPTLKLAPKILELLKEPGIVNQMSHLPKLSAETWRNLFQAAKDTPYVYDVLIAASEQDAREVVGWVEANRLKTFFSVHTIKPETRKWVFRHALQGPAAGKLPNVVPGADFVSFLKNTPYKIPAEILRDFVNLQGRENVEAYFKKAGRISVDIDPQTRLPLDINLIRLAPLVFSQLNYFDALAYAIPLMDEKQLASFTNEFLPLSSGDFKRLLEIIVLENPIPIKAVHHLFKRNAHIAQLKEAIKGMDALPLLVIASQYDPAFIPLLGKSLNGSADIQKAIYDFLVLAEKITLDKATVWEMVGKKNRDRTIDAISARLLENPAYYHGVLQVPVRSINEDLQTQLKKWEENQKDFDQLMTVDFKTLDDKRKGEISSKIEYYVNDLLNPMLTNIRLLEVINQKVYAEQTIVNPFDSNRRTAQSLLSTKKQEILALKNKLAQLQSLQTEAAKFAEDRENEEDIFVFLGNKGINNRVQCQEKLGIDGFQHISAARIDEVADLKKYGIYKAGMTFEQLFKNLKLWIQIAQANPGGTNDQWKAAFELKKNN